MEGWHAAVARPSPGSSSGKRRRPNGGVNVMPGLVSPADLRHLKDILAAYGVAGTILPDISDSMDRPALLDYEKLPAGGTTLSDIRAMSGALGSIEWGRADHVAESAGTNLSRRFGVKNIRVGLPIGIRETDAFFEALTELTGVPTPARYANERGRLVDAYVDGHKYVAGQARHRLRRGGYGHRHGGVPGRDRGQADSGRHRRHLQAISRPPWPRSPRASCPSHPRPGKAWTSTTSPSRRKPSPRTSWSATARATATPGT